MRRTPIPAAHGAMASFAAEEVGKSMTWTWTLVASAAIVVGACASAPGAPDHVGPPTSDTAVAAVVPPSAEPVARTAIASGALHTSRGKLLDAADHEVRLTGVNWFGLETGTFAPHGLWARALPEMLDQIAAAGFNTIRLPYSDQLFDASSKPNGIDPAKNPDLVGLSGLEIMDRVVQGAGQRGLRILLDRHRPTADAQSELWYTDRVPEARWIEDWVVLARRYRGDSTVIGADLHNEPHGSATWGSGDVRTDWRLAAERAGNVILEANPDWLIVVEGVEAYGGAWYWWGGNLTGAGASPVRLVRPDKLVYSAHDYGPGVYEQQWFRAADFPANLPRLWRDRWAYLQLDGIAPVLIGEFGGRSVGSDAEGVWQRSLVGYLRDHAFHYTYWSWNPNSGDTGGMLRDDWQAVDQAKLNVLAAYQWPKLTPVAPREDAPVGATEPIRGPAPLAFVGSTLPLRDAPALGSGVALLAFGGLLLLSLACCAGALVLVRMRAR